MSKIPLVLSARILLMAASAIALPFLMPGQALNAQHATAEAQIRPLIARLDSASSRDPSLVQDLFADSFYTVHGNGNVQRKAEWLALRARLRVRSVDWDEMQFFDYGDVVLVMGVVRRQYDMPDGRPVDERRRMTYVWVRRDGRWQLAATHGTRLGQ